MAWTWALADAAGVAVTPITNSPARRITIIRNQPRAATVDLTHDDQEASALLSILANGVPQLRVYNDGVLWFRGFLAALDESGEATGESKLTASFTDPVGRMLGEQGRFTGAPVSAWTYSQVDAGAIAWDLIDQANAVSDTGIREGTVEATKLRDRAYENKNVAEAIMDLTNVIDGFDFDVAPLDPTLQGGKLGELDVYARQGADRPDVLFGFGAGTVANVAGVRRQQTPPVNKARVVTSEGLEGTAQDADSIARHGLYERVISATDVVEQQTLTDKARDALRPDWVRVVQFTPNPDSAPQPMTDYWVGDTVRFHAREGALLESLSPRVNSITVSVDADDHETHELTIEAEVT